MGLSGVKEIKAGVLHFKEISPDFFPLINTIMITHIMISFLYSGQKSVFLVQNHD